MLTIDATVERGTYSLSAAVTLAAPATGICGPSGAGKSTLLALIAGVVRPSRGRVVLDGMVLDDAAAGIHVPTHRRRLGMVFQHGHLLPHRSVHANLTYGEALVPTGERRLTLDQVVRLLELDGLLERRPSALSGGQRQRVALGRALLCSPRLLLLDEPLAALDGGLKRQILPFLRRIRDSCAIPMIHVAHDLAELQHVSDELLVIDRGRIAGQGPLTTLAQRPELLPLLHQGGLVSVLRATVEREVDGTTVTTLPGGATVLTPALGLAPGSAVELLIRPEDVALAGMAIPDISLQNQLPGTITAISNAADRVVVTVDVGQPLLVEVTARTVAHLGLTIHARVWCLFKAVAVRGQ